MTLRLPGPNYRTFARRLALSLVLIVANVAPIISPASVQLLELVRDFGALGAESERLRKPILLLVSRSDCPYCEIVIREIFDPMLRSGEYEDKVLIRELMSDDPGTIRDFTGHNVSPEAVARRYDANFTPTVLFLDGQGRELVPRIRGINTIDMYSFYLDRSIHQAAARLSGR